MIILLCLVANFAGTVVGDQKVCINGGYKFQIYYGKLFENTNNGTKSITFAFFNWKISL